jgi:catechol 2,3-dioxygenase-like lactoylglutathione lyase family enzyme
VGAIRLEHVNIHTAAYEETKDFFAEVVGLRAGPRPHFDFPGYWMYAGEQPVIHISGMIGGTGSGAINHVSFRATGFLETLETLERLALSYRVAEVPGTRDRQIFVQDPNGVTVELTFADIEAVEMAA